MAKKPKKNGTTYKSISEMDDTEFVKSIDFLSSPYYRAYINARVRAELGRNAWEDGVDMREVERANSDGKTKRYEKKRVVCVLLITVLMLLTVAVCIIGMFSVLPKEYISVMTVPSDADGAKEYITLDDPVLGLFGEEQRAKSVYFTELYPKRSEDATTMTKIALYVVPVASILLFAISIFGFLKSILSLFGGKKDGSYHKYKFGFISILMLLCSVAIVLGGIFSAGIVVDGVADFFTFKSSVLQAGYATYAILIIPVLTFVLSCASYKKTKFGNSRKR